MLREISEEVRVNLKDRLRDARHVIRRHRHDSVPADRVQAAGRAGRPPFPIGIERLLGHAVSAFDDAMSMAEALVPYEPFRNASAIKGFAAYFTVTGATPSLTQERAFRRDMYALAKTVLAQRKIGGMLVHETAFATIHASMTRRHGALLAGLGRQSGWTETVSLAATLLAALLVECLGHQPLRLAETAAKPVAAPLAVEIACLAPVALACGLATVDPQNTAEPDLLAIAILAVDARGERIREALASADPHGELTAIYATLLAHLP